MKRILKIVVVTEEPAGKVAVTLEENNCRVTAIEEMPASWEHLWEGFEQ